MSVDYDFIGGIGIQVTYEMIQELIKNKYFTNEEWEDCALQCLLGLKILVEEAGSGNYGGQRRFYFLINANTLIEANKKADYFLKKVNGFGFKKEFTRKDLKIIKDIHMC